MLCSLLHRHVLPSGSQSWSGSLRTLAMPMMGSWFRLAPTCLGRACTTTRVRWHSHQQQHMRQVSQWPSHVVFRAQAVIMPRFSTIFSGSKAQFLSETGSGLPVAMLIVGLRTCIPTGGKHQQCHRSYRSILQFQAYSLSGAGTALLCHILQCRNFWCDCLNPKRSQCAPPCHGSNCIAVAQSICCSTPGDAAKQAEQQMGQEVDRLTQIVTDMPDDVITRPGEGLGVYSIGYKHLSTIELLVRSARARHLGVGTRTATRRCMFDGDKRDVCTLHKRFSLIMFRFHYAVALASTPCIPR